MSHKVLKRFRIHHRFSHVTAIGVTADVWSDTRHLQPLGKNATFATDMKPLCNPMQLVSKYAFVATKSRAFSPTFSAFFVISQVTRCRRCTKSQKAADCEKLYFAEDGPLNRPLLRFRAFRRRHDVARARKTTKAAGGSPVFRRRFSENDFYDISPLYLRLFLPFHISFRQLLTKRVFVWYNNKITFSTLMQKNSMG